MRGASASPVRTAVRVRPLNAREREHGNGECVTALDDAAVRISHAERERIFEYGFDAVLGPEATQADVYERLLAPLMPDFLYGVTENTCVMAYGQTSAGKSHTMGLHGGRPRGLLPRAAAELFDGLDGGPALVAVSFLRLYNEQITDMLRWARRQPPETPRDRYGSRTDLRVREDPVLGVYVPDLSEHLVSSADELTALVDTGLKESMVQATHMGCSTARQTLLLSLRLERPDSASTLTLVDLAGSERLRKSSPLREAPRIGLSLTALTNVISALATGKGHVPYRDSKLTRLLQFALGGNCESLIVGHVSPSEDAFDESLSTLRYMNRAAQIRNKCADYSAREPTRLLRVMEELQLLRTELSEAVGEEAEELQGCVETLEGLIANI